MILKRTHHIFSRWTDENIETKIKCNVDFIGYEMISSLAYQGKIHMKS